MKTLLLVRHAKSSWDDASLPDRDRPLAGRGLRDVEKMGKRLAKAAVQPDLILSSPALRAMVTAGAIAKLLGYRRRNIVLEERLYACQADDLLEVIRTLDDKYKRVMLVGHNPELSELARRLSSEIGEMPTCAVAELRFETKSWADIGKRDPAHVAVDYPRKE